MACASVFWVALVVRQKFRVMIDNRTAPQLSRLAELWDLVEDVRHICEATPRLVVILEVLKNDLFKPC